MKSEVAPAEAWDCAVVGAGAAGMVAALFSARGGARTIVLEAKDKPGAKIRISGGGRCNVLPSVVELADFHTSGSTNALRNVFATWPLERVREFFEHELGLALYVEPDTGKVFPRSDDAGEVLDALLSAMHGAGARLECGARLARIERLAENANDARAASVRAPGAPGAHGAHGAHPGFRLIADGGREFVARTVILATGGLSVPKTGSDGHGLALARELGHALVPTHPVLVPLFSADPRFAELSGIALRVRLAAKRGERVLEARENDFLFTHKGFSGPVVLDLSRHVTAPDASGVRLCAHWLGEHRVDYDELLRRGGKKTVGGLLREELPRRLVAVLCARAGVDPERKASELSRERRQALLRELVDCELPIAGDDGYRTAEATAGGVALEELVTKSLESRRVPGLYFCGEIVDVVGRIGGFNFLWAWVSGRLAGRSAASASRAASES
ncbi:MAG: aminoacetone oxidase family FAD-binding enzyme [Planctomycetes bacterium]|nr:aminoacetone oxidase family FAD-binding enzyme [Planctomycetota bacterium]